MDVVVIFSQFPKYVLAVNKKKNTKKDILQLEYGSQEQHFLSFLVQSGFLFLKGNMQTLKSQFGKANLTESCLNFFVGQNKFQKLLTHAGANSINFVYML